MAITVTPVDAVAGEPQYSGREWRQAQSALIGGATTARPLGARSGVRPGTPASTVEATSTTWTVHPIAGILDTQASAIAGPYLWASDADVTGAVTAANASNPRKDIIYAQLSDPAESDGSTVPSVTIGYVAGTSNVGGTLVVPTMPARSSRIATINVPVSGGGSPTVTFDPDYAVAAGGIIPVSTLPAVVLGTPQVRVLVDHAGVLYSGNGTAWSRVVPDDPIVQITGGKGGAAPVGAIPIIKVHRVPATMTNASGVINVTFPAAFPNSCAMVAPVTGSGSSDAPVLNADTISTTGFSVAWPANPSTAITFYYTAFGW